VKVPFLDLGAQHAPLRREIDRAIAEVIDRSAFAGGQFVESFEAEFARYCGSKHAIGVGNGTDALWLALLACNVGVGDEVLTVPSTFMATAEAITYCGATPVFVDIDKSTYTMDPSRLERAITSKTKAIVPVHLFGQPADMRPILEIGREKGIPVIEDAAQAHGAEYQGKKAGSLGLAGCFSFYPGKNLGALGEAGAVVTNDDRVAEKIRILRDHGQRHKYHHSMIGWNCRMDGIQGAVLSVKLRHLDRGNAQRRSHAAHYDREFAKLEGVTTPFSASSVRHVYHVYAIRVAERDIVLNRLNEAGIGCGIHYPVPVHLQEAYRHLGYVRGSFPVSEQTSNEFISLPMYPELNLEQRQAVIQAVEETVCSEVLS
jgi:dTDP-4-amino-4,6-dideoxygalactose transaminase